MEDLLDHDLRQKLIDEKVLYRISIWTQCLKGRQKVECCQRCKDLVRNRNGGLSNSHPSVIQLSAHLFIFRSQSCLQLILHLLEVHFFYSTSTISKIHPIFSLYLSQQKKQSILHLKSFLPSLNKTIDLSFHHKKEQWKREASDLAVWHTFETRWQTVIGSNRSFSSLVSFARDAAQVFTSNSGHLGWDQVSN